MSTLDLAIAKTTVTMKMGLKSTLEFVKMARLQKKGDLLSKSTKIV
jgi:hypothetical protein